MFGERAYFGDIADESIGGYYVVCFDDGDFEDWDLSEVKLGKRLCSRIAPQLDYSLWDIFDIIGIRITKFLLLRKYILVLL